MCAQRLAIVKLWIPLHLESVALETQLADEMPGLLEWHVAKVSQPVEEMLVSQEWLGLGFVMALRDRVETLVNRHVPT